MQGLQAMAQQVFVRIKYLDTEGLFNPHCRCLILLECLRKKCNLPDDMRIDLVDERGQLTTLSDHPNEYASSFLRGRRTYIVIKITRPISPDGDFYAYEPLLEDVEDEYPELVDTLKVLSRPTKSTIGKHVTSAGSRKRNSPKASKSEKVSQSRPRLR